MRHIEVLKVEEATEQMRAAGILISPTTVRRGLEQGKFEFGIAIQAEKGYKYLIFTRQFDEWMDKRSVRDVEAK